MEECNECLWWVPSKDPIDKVVGMGMCQITEEPRLGKESCSEFEHWLAEEEDAKED